MGILRAPNIGGPNGIRTRVTDVRVLYNSATDFHPLPKSAIFLHLVPHNFHKLPRFFTYRRPKGDPAEDLFELLLDEKSKPQKRRARRTCRGGSKTAHTRKYVLLLMPRFRENNECCVSGGGRCTACGAPTHPASVLRREEGIPGIDHVVV